MTQFNVVTGSTSLASSGFKQLQDKTIGFIGNHTSRLNDGTSTIAAIIQSQTCQVSRLFAPEHGAFGRYDEEVEDELDPLSGLTIHSLYGETRKPTQEMLSGLDCLVFELQDVGARFYTYCATLLLAIDAASERGIKVLVLDRPNPIGGSTIEGPVADEVSYSFVAPYSLPIRTGLTLGELAALYALETNRKETVEVIKAEGWNRSSYFDDTGITWISPSPAMVSLSTAFVYPGVCLLEQTNVSVGRGTATPFELVGAPFINGSEWEKRMNDQNLTGVQFTAAQFKPTSSKHSGESCNGLEITVTDRNVFQPLSLGIALLTTLRDMSGDQFELVGIKNLLASKKTLSMLLAGHNSQRIVESWKESLQDFEVRRQSIMLYGG